MTHPHTPLQFRGEDTAHHSWHLGRKRDFATSSMTDCHPPSRGWQSGYDWPRLARSSFCLPKDWSCLRKEHAPRRAIKVGVGSLASDQGSHQEDQSWSPQDLECPRSEEVCLGFVLVFSLELEGNQLSDLCIHHSS